MFSKIFFSSLLIILFFSTALAATTLEKATITNNSCYSFKNFKESNSYAEIRVFVNKDNFAGMPSSGCFIYTSNNESTKTNSVVLQIKKGVTASFYYKKACKYTAEGIGTMASGFKKITRNIKCNNDSLGVCQCYF